MSEGKGKKRSKAYYRKCEYGNKKQKTDSNHLMPGVKGFLIMCNNNEMAAVREGYNILNEYADAIYGQGKSGDDSTNPTEEKTHDSSDSDNEDDLEAALKKEVADMKSVPSQLKRFQNCKTQAKNCVFIRSTVSDPVKVALSVMEDVASRRLSRARYAARVLPVVATCKAHTPDIVDLAKTVLQPVFSPSSSPPRSYTVVFKARNNNTSSCGKTSVIPALRDVVRDINAEVEFSWSDFELAVVVEVVCKVCCVIVAPSYARLRKYNLQELAQGPKEEVVGEKKESEVEVTLLKDDGTPVEDVASVGEKKENGDQVMTVDDGGTKKTGDLSDASVMSEVKEVTGESTENQDEPLTEYTDGSKVEECSEAVEKRVDKTPTDGEQDAVVCGVTGKHSGELVSDLQKDGESQPTVTDT